MPRKKSRGATRARRKKAAPLPEPRTTDPPETEPISPEASPEDLSTPAEASLPEPAIPALVSEEHPAESLAEPPPAVSPPEPQNLHVPLPPPPPEESPSDAAVPEAGETAGHPVSDKPSPEPTSGSSTGLSESVAGGLSYLLFWISGVAFFLLEEKSARVRFHAAQSILVFGFFSLALFAILPLAWAPWVGPFFLGLSGAVAGLAVATWILCMADAFRGRIPHLPIASSVARTLAGIPEEFQKSEEIRRTPTLSTAPPPPEPLASMETGAEKAFAETRAERAAMAESAPAELVEPEDERTGPSPELPVAQAQPAPSSPPAERQEEAFEGPSFLPTPGPDPSEPVPTPTSEAELPTISPEIPAEAPEPGPTEPCEVPSEPARPAPPRSIAEKGGAREDGPDRAGAGSSVLPETQGTGRTVRPPREFSRLPLLAFGSLIFAGGIVLGWLAKSFSGSSSPDAPPAGPEPPAPLGGAQIRFPSEEERLALESEMASSPFKASDAEFIGRFPRETRGWKRSEAPEDLCFYRMSGKRPADTVVFGSRWLGGKRTVRLHVCAGSTVPVHASFPPTAIRRENVHRGLRVQEISDAATRHAAIWLRLGKLFLMIEVQETDRTDDLYEFLDTLDLAGLATLE